MISLIEKMSGTNRRLMIVYGDKWKWRLVRRPLMGGEPEEGWRRDIYRACVRECGYPKRTSIYESGYPHAI